MKNLKKSRKDNNKQINIKLIKKIDGHQEDLELTLKTTLTAIEKICCFHQDNLLKEN